MIDFYGATALVWWALGLLAYVVFVLCVAKITGRASRYERGDWLLHRDRNVVNIREHQK